MTDSARQGLRDSDRFVGTTFNRQLVPAILSVAGVLAGTMANSLIAGNLLGHEALAVMSIGSPVYSIFATVGSLAGVGGASLAAWCVGKNDSRGGDGAFTMAAVLSVGLSLVLAALGLLFLDPFLTLLGAEGELHALARPYVALFLLGGVGVAGIYPPFFFLKLEGRLRLSMALFVGLAVGNVGLDFLFVLTTGLGCAGIALATAISNVAAALAGWLCLLGRRGTFRLCSPRRCWGGALRLAAAGSPAALNNLCNVLRAIALNLIISPLAGSAGLSVLNIVTTAGSLALTVINGLAQTTVPFVGVFSSERDNASLRQLERRAAAEGCAVILPVSALLIVFAAPFSRLFGVSDPAVLAQSAPAVAIFAVSLLPSMLSTILVNYYQSGGFTRLANLFTVCRALLFVVLPALLLSRRLGLRGVWISFTVAELLSWAVLALALLVYHRRHRERGGVLLLDEFYEKNGAYISFSVHSTVEEIMDASRRISDFCESNRLSEQRSMLISLSLEEMLISIKDHCFPEDGEQSISIRILIAAQDQEGGDPVIVLRIRCSGAPFNPVAYYEERQAARALEQPEPEALDLEELDLENFELPDIDDSLGIAMIVSSAQMVDYKSTFGVNNLTVLL